jgi:DNA-binding transcriptional LysR family regulator
MAWIGYSEFGGAAHRLKLRDRAGRYHVLTLSPRVRTSSALQVKNWTLEGLGVTRLPEFLIRSELASGTLVQLLPDYSFAEPSLFALHSKDRYRPARLAALIAHLTAK